MRGCTRSAGRRSGPRRGSGPLRFSADCATSARRERHGRARPAPARLRLRGRGLQRRPRAAARPPRRPGSRTSSQASRTALPTLNVVRLPWAPKSKTPVPVSPVETRRTASGGAPIRSCDQVHHAGGQRAGADLGGAGDDARLCRRSRDARWRLPGRQWWSTSCRRARRPSPALAARRSRWPPGPGPAHSAMLGDAMIWPLRATSPARRSADAGASIGSSPRRRAISSMCASTASTICGPDGPRYAPVGWVFV